MRMGRNLLLSLSDRAAMLLAQVAIAVLISRIFGPHGYGLFQVAVTAPILVATVADLGMATANNYFAARHRDRSGFVENSLVLGLATGGLGGLATVAGFAVFRTTLFSEMPESFRWWMGACALVHTLNFSLSGLIYGFDQFRERFIGTIMHYGVFLLSVLLLGMLGALNVHLLFPLWTTSLAGSVLFLLGVLFLRQRPGRPRVELALLGKQLKYARFAYVYSIAQTFNFRLDMMLVAYFLPVEFVGWYGLAAKISETILYLPKSLANVVLSGVAVRGSARAEAEERDLVIYRAVTLSSGLTIVAVGAVAWAGIPYVFSRDFVPSIVPLYLLLPGTVSMSLGIVASYHLFGLGRGWEASLAAIVGTCLIGLLDVVLIPLFGIPGAAVASTLAYTGFALMVFRFLLRELRTAPQELLAPTWKDFALLKNLARHGRS